MVIMKNKEIEELLNELKNEDNYIEEYGFRYKRIALDDWWWLLLSYIEQLENNRDKAIEILENRQNNLFTKEARKTLDDDIEIALKILKGDSDE